MRRTPWRIEITNPDDSVEEIRLSIRETRAMRRWKQLRKPLSAKHGAANVRLVRPQLTESQKWAIETRRTQALRHRQSQADPYVLSKIAHYDRLHGRGRAAKLWGSVAGA